MRNGKMPDSGDVILTRMNFVDTSEMKTRPALVLYEEYGNIVVAGITSNLKMKGVLLTRKDGAMKDSIIKLNYIFTISDAMIKKELFSLSSEKRKQVYSELVKKINAFQ